jgi:hypothetical protein
MVPLATDEEIANLFAALGESENPNRGSLIMLAANCLGEGAADMTIQADDNVDSSSTYFYLGGWTGLELDVAATKTNFTGAAGIANVMPGQTTIRTIRNGETVGTASVLVRAGTVTMIHLGPTP